MKFFMIDKKDYFDEDCFCNLTLINVNSILYFDIFEESVRIYLINDYYLDVTLDCYNSLLAFIQSI